jgi:hypothetical protein
MTETITDDKHYVFMTGTIYFLQVEEKKKSSKRLQAA